MNTARLRMLCLSIVALVTTGCALLDEVGGSKAPSPAPAPAPAPSSAAVVSGTVHSVDPSAHTLTLGAGARNQTSLRSSDRTVLSYDSSTVVEYQGQKAYNPQDLEAGDQIEAQVERSGSSLLARSIKVISSVSDGGGTAGQRQIHGTIRNIDTVAHSIVLDGAAMEQVQGFDTTKNGSSTTIAYDASTIVEYQGQRYGIANLERGDAVRIDISPIGNGYLAKRITVAQAR